MGDGVRSPFRKKDAPRVITSRVDLQTYHTGECPDGSKHDFAHFGLGEGEVCLKCHQISSFLGMEYLDEERFQGLWNTAGLYRKGGECVNPDIVAKQIRDWQMRELHTALSMFDCGLKRLEYSSSDWTIHR